MILSGISRQKCTSLQNFEDLSPLSSPSKRLNSCYFKRGLHSPVVGSKCLYLCFLCTPICTHVHHAHKVQYHHHSGAIFFRAFPFRQVEWIWYLSYLYHNMYECRPMDNFIWENFALSTWALHEAVCLQIRICLYGVHPPMKLLST